LKKLAAAHGASSSRHDTFGSIACGPEDDSGWRLANLEELQRFEKEAAAAAHYSIPNIVAL